MFARGTTLVRANKLIPYRAEVKMARTLIRTNMRSVF